MNNDIIVNFEDNKDIEIKLENKTYLNLQNKTITPTTEEQIITSDSGYDGLSKVIVQAVTSSIDANITQENIKAGVSILGVTGTYEGVDTSKEIIEGTIVNLSTSATEIRNYALYYISTLINFIGNSVTTIGTRVFQNCVNLESVTIPNVTSIGTYAFYVCSKLNNVSLPNLTTLTENVFRDCSTLNYIYIPNVTSIGGFCFSRCNFINITLPKVTSIGYGAFERNNNLLTMTLESDQVCAINSTTSLPASSSHHINIYVPSDLIESYKTATNWSTLYNNGYITFNAIS